VEESLRNAVVDEYNRKGKENMIEKDLLMLRRNRITTLNEWSGKSKKEKNKFPSELQVALNQVSSK
jgi:hypothetical protein